MSTTSRPTEHLTIGGYPSHSAAASTRSVSPSGTSPRDPSPGAAIRSPFGLPAGLPPAGKMAGTSRSGTGSPSHDMPASGRLYSKRAREIQAQEGVPGLPVNPWGGPPTSGNSTPLRENIPESPTDGFPDFTTLPTPESLPQTRRARAGTVPSRFSPGGAGNGLPGAPSTLATKTCRPSPTPSPFPTPPPGLEGADSGSRASALLSRLRAGSMPQRSPYAHVPGTHSPFGPSIFSSWNPGRERGTTLASIASIGSNGPSSPAQSQFSKDGPGENEFPMRTLDYLGLAETPQSPRAQLATPYYPSYTDMGAKQANRFRSYSVNNKDKYADDDEDEYLDSDDLAMVESQYAQLQDQLAATQAAIHSHNLAVQAFANQAVATRPRARTAGVLDAPGHRVLRTYYPTPSRLDARVCAAEIRLPDEKDLEDLPQVVAAMSMGRSNSRNNGLLGADEQGLEGPTSALWLGSIPTSTTTSTLTEMFKSFGPICSARVLTHKSCGFVNFERVDSAMAAKANLNGKEIFPGAGPIRINFAKPPSASTTPVHEGAFPSPSPDPLAQGDSVPSGLTGTGVAEDGPVNHAAAPSTPTVSPLADMVHDILEIVKHFGASEDGRLHVSASLQSAINYDAFVNEIPPIKEPSHTRVYDAPKLRDMRKKIDNQTLSQAEVESVAVDMLPEIAELSSDYLGNTVVQKLFEHCSDSYRYSMLEAIAPHMAEIGVHKNGTWAAQKIIDVCKTPHQMSLIVQHLRAYTVPLFLDQYGNYVLQGCLKFGAPYNDFIFETMLSRMWEIAQGRYGARAMRACLESHHATKDQQRMLAAAIALHSVQLATNANGALLLTWFLDTCTYPQRRTVLSPQLAPHLVHLCTHKVAYLTVLKVINQKAEGDARDIILKALFFAPNDQVLEAILRDHTCGATLIFKVLTTPFFDEMIRSQVVDNVKTVLVRIKAQPSQGYKRLMDEVGLSTRSGGGASRDHAHGNGSHERPRPASRHASSHGQHHSSQRQRGQHGQQAPQLQPAPPGAQQQQGAPFNGNGKPFYSPHHGGVNPSGFELGFGLSRNESADHGIATPFPAFAPQPSLLSPNHSALPPAAAHQHMHYQQSVMSRGTPPMNNFLPTMHAGYGGFPSPSPSTIDPYRSPNLLNQSPIQHASAALPNVPAGQAPYVTPSLGMNMGLGGGGGIDYGGMGCGIQNMAYMQEHGNARRGRR